MKTVIAFIKAAINTQIEKFEKQKQRELKVEVEEDIKEYDFLIFPKIWSSWILSLLKKELYAGWGMK